MPIRSLQNIIRVENELYANEQAEAEKIEKWQQAKEKEIIAEYREKYDKLEDRRNKIKQQAVKDAEKRASEILRAADQKTSRLAGLDDKTLSSLLREHLRSIVSGSSS